MPGDRDKAVFLALGLDDRMRISFSGQRYYQLCEVGASTLEIRADIMPVHYNGCLPVGPPGSEADLDYRDWLTDNGMNDPLWDEVLLPYYEAIIVLPDGERYRMRMKVEVLEWRSQNHRVRLIRQ